jgi:uncharacterized protein YciI
MFVIRLTYTKPLHIMDQLRPSHVEFLDRYYAEGIFLVSGRQNPPIGGVILAHNISREALERLLTEDPFAIEHAATYEIIEFSPTKYSPSLAAIFI